MFDYLVPSQRLTVLNNRADNTHLSPTPNDSKIQIQLDGERRAAGVRNDRGRDEARLGRDRAPQIEVWGPKALAASGERDAEAHVGDKGPGDSEPGPQNLPESPVLAGGAAVRPGRAEATIVSELPVAGCGHSDLRRHTRSAGFLQHSGERQLQRG